MSTKKTAVNPVEVQQAEKPTECPKCKQKTFRGHWYHQAGKCTDPKCGFFHPWDD